MELFLGHASYFIFEIMVCYLVGHEQETLWKQRINVAAPVEHIRLHLYHSPEKLLCWIVLTVGQARVAGILEVVRNVIVRVLIAHLTLSIIISIGQESASCFELF